MVREFESHRFRQFKEKGMTQKEVLDKAYGSMSKEVGYSADMFAWMPTPRGIKYYFLKLKRFLTR